VDLASIVKILNLKVYSGMDQLNRSILGGYTGDLLSDVMANSQEGNIWVTRQVHQNIVAVASLKDHAGIILVHGAEPAKDTLDKAIKENIPLMVSDQSGFEVVGQIYTLIKEEKNNTVTGH
jgi:predicted transcriptional regulator